MRESRSDPEASNRSGRRMLTIVLVAVLAVIAIIVIQQRPQVAGSPDGVTIRIEAPAATPISIDGAPAGRSPLSLRLAPSKHPISIQGNGVTKTITPDRDQTVQLRE